MRKLFALFLNEMTKALRRVSLLVVMIIMVVFLIGYSLLTYTASSFSYYYSEEDMESELNYYQEEKESLKIKLEAMQASTETDAIASAAEIQNDIDYMENEIYIIKLFMDNGIDRYSSTDFRSDVIYRISDYSYELISLRRQAKLDPDAQAKVNLYEGYINTLEQIVKNKDYKSYIDFSKESTNSDESLSAEQKEINNEYYDLLYLNDPDGTGNVSGLTTALQAIKDERLSLSTGLNYVDFTKQGMPLSIEDEEYIKNKLAVDRYNVENGYTEAYDPGSKDYFAATSVDNSLSLGTTFIVIIVMILAGTAISQEIATGSIKSLIIAPVKRWKIMTAKILSLLTITISSMLVLYLISLGISTLLYGTSVQNPYVYASGGVVHEIPFLLYELSVLGILAIKVIVYFIFSLLLSTITRNSSLSVGLSIGTYFGISSIASVFTSTFTGEWTKFLPFSHLDLLSRIFEYSPTYTTGYSGLLDLTTTSTSLQFSIIYIAVLTFTMLLTAYDSFNHRDIK